MADEDCSPIIIENGTGNCKVGFAGDKSPYSVFPTIVARPRHLVDAAGVNLFIGDDAQVKRRVYWNISNPVDNGFITNFDDMERIWHHCFYNELGDRIQPEDLLNDVVLIEPSLNSGENREKMAEIMFESFNIQNSLCIANEAVLALYSYGLNTGISVDVGVASKVVPVIEGKVVTHGVSREFNISGDELNLYLGELMKEIGYTFDLNEQFILKDVKEKSCFVVLDFEEKMKTLTEATHEIYDGRVLSLGNVAFRGPEVIFQPSLMKSKNISKGIHQIVYESAMKCDSAIQSNLFANIVLSGGHSMLPGFDKRLQKELGNLVPLDTSIEICFEDCKRRNASWLGGSMLASSEHLSSSYEQISITKDEYDDIGPTIVHQKVL